MALAPFELEDIAFSVAFGTYNGTLGQGEDILHFKRNHESFGSLICFFHSSDSSFQLFACIGVQDCDLSCGVTSLSVSKCHFSNLCNAANGEVVSVNGNNSVILKYNIEVSSSYELSIVVVDVDDRAGEVVICVVLKEVISHIDGELTVSNVFFKSCPVATNCLEVSEGGDSGTNVYVEACVEESVEGIDINVTVETETGVFESFFVDTNACAFADAEVEEMTMEYADAFIAQASEKGYVNLFGIQIGANAFDGLKEILTDKFNR